MWGFATVAKWIFEVFLFEISRFEVFLFEVSLFEVFLFEVTLKEIVPVCGEHRCATAHPTVSTIVGAPGTIFGMRFEPFHGSVFGAIRHHNLLKPCIPLQVRMKGPQHCCICILTHTNTLGYMVAGGLHEP